MAEKRQELSQTTAAASRRLLSIGMFAIMALIMSTTPIPIDISHNKDLRKLAEEVEATRIPRALIRDDETVAVLIPVGKENKTEKKSKDEAFAAMLSALGSWSDLDTDTMIKNIYKAREEGSRPPARP